MKHLIVPESLYIVLLYGGIILSLVSIFMGVRGIIKKNQRRHFIKWCVILFVSIVLVALTTTGIIVANTMFGG